MRYMIHACPAREWYVDGVLVPMMLEQGIRRQDIVIWMDSERKGNLVSCLESFASCSRYGDGGTWHLQDDVVISRRFRAETEAREADNRICSGFVHADWQMFKLKAGIVPAVFMHNSFQCIRIPDKVAVDFARWVICDAHYLEDYEERVAKNKCDDAFFYDYVVSERTNDYVDNLYPAIVDHIDYLIGGSVINKWRGATSRSEWWDDNEAYQDVIRRIAQVKGTR